MHESPKEIMLLINSLGGGGAEGVCVNIANSLCGRGWKVTVVVLHLNKAVRHKELLTSVELIVLGKKHARSSFFALSVLLKKRKPKKILVFNHQLAVVLVLVRAVLGFNFNILARNINTLSRKRFVETSFWHKHIVHVFTKLFYKKVDLVIAQSKGMEKDLLSYYGIIEEKVITIHNPVNPAFENVPVGGAGRKCYLLCVGRLESQKAFHNAIIIFSRISPSYPGLRLKIVGQGRLEKDLKELACSLGIIDSVDFEGYQSDLIPYYLKAKATLLTSVYEGFPNVLVESITLGTPVVSFDCPSGPSEIVINGVNGYLVKDRSFNDFEIKLRKLIDNELKASLVRDTASRFSSDKVVSCYEKLLK